MPQRTIISVVRRISLVMPGQVVLIFNGSEGKEDAGQDDLKKLIKESVREVIRRNDWDCVKS